MNLNKPLLIASVAVVLVAAGTVITLQATRVTHLFGSSSDSKQQQQATQYEHDKKAATINSGGNPANTDASGNPTASSGSYTPPDSASNIVIRPSRQNDQVVISTELHNYSDGSCTLTASNNGQTITKTAQVIYAPNFSTCAGFSLPVSSLGNGTWNISLAVTAGNTTITQTASFAVQ